MRNPLLRALSPWALFVLLAWIAGCNTNAAGNGDDESSGDTPDSTAVEEEEAVPVEVTVLQRGSIESVLRASANLEAESSVGVYAEAARRVVELLVEEGAKVDKGELLLRLQSDAQRSDLAKAQSNLEKAQREATRQESLHERGLTTDQALNDALYELDQQKIAVEDAQRELSYTQVRAPIAGTVTARLVNLGDQVQIGQHLFDIIDFDSLVARIYVPEKNLKELQPKQTARVTAPALPGREYRGAVDRIAPVVDPQSGTVKVTLSVGGQPDLRPGLYVDVALITAVHDDALLVPKRALVYDNDQVFVYRLGPERKVERLAVMPVLSNREFIEPASGLAVGDSVVIAGQAALKDGARVELYEEPTAAEPASTEAAEDAEVAGEAK